MRERVNSFALIFYGCLAIVNLKFSQENISKFGGTRTRASDTNFKVNACILRRQMDRQAESVKTFYNPVYGAYNELPKISNK